MITQLCEPLGWTLLHLLWQGTAIAAVYGGRLPCFRHSVRARYAQQSASATVRAKPAAGGVAAHILTVQGADGKGIPEFRIIASVRSGMLPAPSPEGPPRAGRSTKG
jgi:hypothetical protein